MTTSMWAGVSLLGGLGAMARTALDRAITYYHRGVYPLGIFIVNMLGTLALGEWREVPFTELSAAFGTLVADIEARHLSSPC